MEHRAGFVNILGNPNVGKSTLMNRLVGEKLSIITSKSQTTRHRIKGIVNGEDFQIVFSDTPGVVKPSYKMQEYMLDFSKSAIIDADIFLYVTDVVDIIEKAHQAGVLTALGEDVRKRMALVWEDAEGLGGDLTPLGVRQHRGEAERMNQNYPEVFKGTPALSARSTVVLRCVLSMDAFCERLKELNPALQIRREACARYMKYMNYHTPEAVKFVSHQGPWYEEYRKFKESHTRPDRLVTSLFNSPDYIRKNVNPDELMWGLYWIASDLQNVEIEVSLYDVFQKDELFDLWQVCNYHNYVCDGPAPANGGIMTASARSLLENILDSADEAIRSGTHTATFRFGHDGNIIPLVALLQLGDMWKAETDPDKFYQAWCNFKVTPMAANVQLGFFRKKASDDILVKFMHCEKEVTIPVETDIAPFYHWKDVETYYRHLLHKLP